MSKNLSLGERQELFSECLGKLLVWIPTNPGWKVRMGEGYVALTDGRDKDHDGPHKLGGGHYNKTAQDLDLFIDGQWITSSSHSAWHAVDKFWRTLHPLCRTGIGFGDANHVAVLLRTLPDGREVF